MAQIINLTQVLNERRAAAENAQREARALERMNARTDEVADFLWGSPLAQVIAAGIVATEEKAKAPKFVPAYCDPENESRGAKHDATKSLDIAEIAKRVRQDIAAAQKAGTIDKAVKCSVRISRYSGGQSLDVKVIALPADFPVYSERYLEHRAHGGTDHDFAGHWTDQQSDELKALIAALEAIHGAYNRDNSDSMSDYFDRRYYGHAELDWECRRDAQAAHLRRAGIA